MKFQFKAIISAILLCAAISMSASNNQTAQKNVKRTAENELKSIRSNALPLPGAATASVQRVNKTPTNLHAQNALRALYAHAHGAAKQKSNAAAADTKRSTESAAAAKAQKPFVKRSCNVCMDDKKDERFIKLSCGHDLTCFRCLKAMLMNVFKDKTTAPFKCPYCKKELSLIDVKALTATKSKHNAFDTIILKELLAKNPLIKHCPTPQCTVMYELPDLNASTRQTIQCEKCKKSYCSHCQASHSNKISCKEAQENRTLGSDKAKAEKASEELIKKTTKACPQCNKNIEKNQGCNHMTCSQCHHEFCWTCLGDYKTSGCTSSYCAKGRIHDDLDDESDDDLGDIEHFLQLATLRLGYLASLESRSR